MSMVEEEMHKYNALQAEERLRTEAEHMAEMAQKNATVKKVIAAPIVDGSVQGTWKRRAAWWAKVLAVKQQKK
jgi:dihydroxyacetone kinase DhaKLM complex PTS-EIIA-like component DhaM